MAETITVLRPGLSTLQDLGRPGAAAIGQMAAGALDRYSVEVANALVASPARAPVVEIVASDFAATTSTDLLIAITGSPACVRIDGVVRSQWEPLVWPAHTTLTIADIHRGLRVYFAVHGTVHADTLLGSCAPDTVLGFGRSLAAGDRVPVDVDCPPVTHPHFGIPLFRPGARPHDFPRIWTIPATDGPDAAEFGASADRLWSTEFEVGTDSNHIGLRMSATDGTELPRREVTGELLSRGVPIGAIEVPAGDELLVLHRGRGVTAGYPVLAVVTAIGLSQLGQVRPGQRVRFARTGIDDAVDAFRRQQSQLSDLRTRIHTIFTSIGIPDHSGPRTTPARSPRSALTLESA